MSDLLRRCDECDEPVIIWREGEPAFCAHHCREHEFGYDRDLCRHVCEHCGGDAPEDWGVPND